MTNEFKVTKENVLKAAQTNPCAADTLKALFPDAFLPEDTLAIAVGKYKNSYSRPLREFCEEAFGSMEILQINDVNFSKTRWRSLYVLDTIEARITTLASGTQIIEFHKKQRP